MYKVIVTNEYEEDIDSAEFPTITEAQQWIQGVVMDGEYSLKDLHIWKAVKFIPMVEILIEDE